MNQIILISRNTIRDILSRKALYVLVGAVLLLFVIYYNFIFMFQKAVGSGNRDLAAKLALNLAGSTLGIWFFLGFILALWLGSTALVTEIRSKTIVTILTRPVARWQFLIGKWLGVNIFILLFTLIGVIIALLILSVYGLPIHTVLLFGLVQKIVSLALITSLCIFFTTFLSTVGTIVALSLLSTLGSLYQAYLSQTRLGHSIYDLLLYFPYPASLGEDLVNLGLSTSVISADYFLYFQVVSENFLYMIAVLLVAAVIFDRP